MSKMMAGKDFKIGDLVWAKMKNFPFWPAEVVNPPTVKGKVFPTSKEPQKKKPMYRKAQHYVFFFGSKNYAWISDKNIVPHSDEMLNKLTKKKSGSYAKAIHEIVEASLANAPKPKLGKKDYVENGDSDKITEIPSIKENELFKKPRVRSVRRDRPTKLKNVGEKMEKPSQKRNLPEATDKKLPLKKCRIFLPPNILSNTDNPAAVIRPLVYQSRAAPECSELPPPPQKRNLPEATDKKLPLKNCRISLPPNILSNTDFPVAVIRPLVDQSRAAPECSELPPPQKRNLPEATDKKLPLKNCRISLPPNILSNTDNPASVIRPLVDQSRAAPECSELPPTQKRNLPEARDKKLPLKNCRISLPPNILSNTDNPASVIRPLVDQSRAAPECSELPPPQKRNLPEARDKKLPLKNCRISLPPNILSNTDNPASVIRPLVDQSRAAPECSELPPRPSLDLSKPIIPLKEYMEPTSKKIGFIGLGMKGQRIVKNLLHSGHDVSVWNRTSEKCEQFVKAGAKHLSTPADVVQNCDIIFCCVSGPEASKSVVFENRGILEGLEKCRFGTKGYVEMTCIDYHISQEIAKAISERGGIYLEAPITGSVSAAEEGAMLLISAGDHELFDSCLTCFFSICKNFFYLGCDVGSASKMNLIHSMLMKRAHAALAKTMALVDRFNISRSMFLEMVQLYPFPFDMVTGQAFVDQSFLTNTSRKPQNSLTLALILSRTLPLILTSAANELNE